MTVAAPPLAGWATIASRTAHTYEVTVIVGLTATANRQDDLI
jgi:hypothetical protein